jgi:hypothetical protein
MGQLSVSEECLEHSYRFGADILTCKECVTQREFLTRGLIQSLGFHIVSALALLFFSVIGKSNGVAFVGPLCLMVAGYPPTSLFSGVTPYSSDISRLSSRCSSVPLPHLRNTKVIQSSPYSSLPALPFNISVSFIK